MISRRLGAGRLRFDSRPQDWRIPSTYRSARDSRRQMRRTQPRRGYPEKKEKTVSLLDVRPARRNRSALWGGECFRPQLLGISCMVALAHNLLVQAPTTRKEAAG